MELDSLLQHIVLHLLEGAWILMHGGTRMVVLNSRSLPLYGQDFEVCFSQWVCVIQQAAGCKRACLRAMAGRSRVFTTGPSVAI